MNEKDIYDILKEALFEFPVLSVSVNIPDWIACLSYKHPLKKEYIEKIKESVVDVDSFWGNWLKYFSLCKEGLVS